MRTINKYTACLLCISIMIGNMPPASFSFAAMPGAQATPSDATGIEGEEFKENDLWKATSSNAQKATLSEAVIKANSLGDIWDEWSGKTSFEFLSGNQGMGSKEKPYMIKNREQLMGLSELTAMGMAVQTGTGSYAGDYSGSYFALASSIDMQGIDWIPIGFYRDSSEKNGPVTNMFEGHFDGNGYTIKNLKLNTFSENDYVGLFGMVANSEIKNLTIIPDSSYYITGKSKVGTLAGAVENSTIKDITINGGAINASGIAGGLVGEAVDTTIENVDCNNVKADAQNSLDIIYIGGITGQATSSVILDCSVTTGNNISACIKGRGYVGGITGSQNGTDIYNTYVSGTIGG